MLISRFFVTAAAAGLMTYPLAALAQSAQPAAPPTTAAAPPAAAPATPPAGGAAVAASPHVVANGNIISTLQGSGHFTMLLKALDATNLTATLKTTPDLTLFAPTDAAFAALPPAQLALLMAPRNASVLQKVLTYHLVHLNLDSSKIKGSKGPVESVETGKLVLDGSGPVLKVNDASIIQPDVRVTNGYIQVVDKVLIPADVTLPAASAAAPAPAAPSGG
ncbi:MAG: fasciclin domain-containing protein [Caulobacteraceae bacterium]